MISSFALAMPPPAHNPEAPLRSKRKRPTAGDKEEICKKATSINPQAFKKWAHAELAAYCNAHRSTIAKMLREKDRWGKCSPKSQSNEEQTPQNPAKKSSRRSMLPHIDEALEAWHIGCRLSASGELSVTDSALQLEAIKIRDKIVKKLKSICESLNPADEEKLSKILRQIEKHSEFKASNGWLQKRKSRAMTFSRKLRGERDSADFVAVARSQKRMKKLIDKCNIGSALNADEAGALYMTGPSRSNAPARAHSSGHKRSRSRIACLLTASMLGEKMPLTAAGKSKKPRALKSADALKRCKIFCFGLKSAWMNRAIFASHLKGLSKMAVSGDRRILLLLGNASAHHKDERIGLKNLDIAFFDANITSVAQPCDQGECRSFKARCRSALLSQLLILRDSWLETIHENFPNQKLQVKNYVKMDIALQLAGQAWESAPPSVIMNAWLKSGILPDAHERRLKQEVSKAKVKARSTASLKPGALSSWSDQIIKNFEEFKRKKAFEGSNGASIGSEFEVNPERNELTDIGKHLIEMKERPELLESLKVSGPGDAASPENYIEIDDPEMLFPPEEMDDIVEDALHNAADAPGPEAEGESEEDEA